MDSDLVYEIMGIISDELSSISFTHDSYSEWEKERRAVQDRISKRLLELDSDEEEEDDYRAGMWNMWNVVWRTSNDQITSLEPWQVFVFGSNLAGVHGGGAAAQAYKHFGAKWGVGRGKTGNCYAIPTKDENIETLPLHHVEVYVAEFIDYAKEHPDLTFLVTEIGCGLAGFKVEQIAPLFADAIRVGNIHLPARFWDLLI